jgi:hypothetical protein
MPIKPSARMSINLLANLRLEFSVDNIGNIIDHSRYFGSARFRAPRRLRVLAKRACAKLNAASGASGRPTPR